jgi:hypothetical protein
MGSPDPHSDPAQAIVAYCAPGQLDHARRFLASRKERYGELVEHPYMAGRTDIVLTTDPVQAGEDMRRQGRPEEPGEPLPRRKPLWARLYDDPGVSADELPALEAGMLALADPAGSDGLFLTVNGCPAAIRFENAAEAYEIAGAILAGLHTEIEREKLGS